MDIEKVIYKCLTVYHASARTPLGAREPLEIELPIEEVKLLKNNEGQFPGIILTTPNGTMRVMGVLVKEKTDG